MANALIVHGNTVSMLCFVGYLICSTALDSVIRPLDAMAAKSILTTTAKSLDANWPAVIDTPTSPQLSPQAPPAMPFHENKKGQFGFDF